MKWQVDYTDTQGNPAWAQIFINLYRDELPFDNVAPNTRYTPLFAKIDRGSNVYGKMICEVFFCLDNNEDSTRLVMWVGDNGSQWDDNVGRILPIAWTIPFEHSEDIELDDPNLLAAVFTDVAMWMIKETWIEPSARISGGDVVQRNLLDSCWSEACELAGEA